MHTKDRLAATLRQADLPAMAERAAAGRYDDFLSPLAAPALELERELREVGTPAALAVRARHMNGDFDGSLEESEAWAASPEGREAFAALVGEPREQEVGRLAMRVEGEFWNAYFAQSDTMAGAVFLGSIAMKVVQNRDRKREFMTLMQGVVADILEEVTGVRPSWSGTRPAPESERA